MGEALRKFAPISLRAERESATAMRKLLADLDRELKVLKARKTLDRTAQTQIRRILNRQSAAWSELSRIIERDKEAARLAANKIASAADARYLDRLSLTLARRRALEKGTPFSRRSITATAQRVSQSNAVARALLTKRLNEQQTGTGLANVAKAQLQPKVTGGVSYVAKRLVRTEMATAFHTAQIERASQTPWVKGMRWKLSETHKGKDICNTLANRVFAVNSVPDIPHPNCMCTLEPVFVSNKEFDDMLAAGLFDSLIGNGPVGTEPRRKQL